MMKSKLKVILTVICAAVFATALFGCATQQSTSTQSSSSQTSAAQQSADQTASDTAASSSNILIAYYSASGNTERIATDIAKNLGADLFAIEPAEPYSSEDLDWTDSTSRVSTEYADESLRDIPLVQTTPDNFADYDTVFLGYPIWWGIAAWPVDGFVSGNDFTGKTIIPFCTSASSGLGNSAQLLEEISNGGTWLEGMRFSSSANADYVTTWLDSLDLA